MRTLSKLSNTMTSTRRRRTTVRSSPIAQLRLEQFETRDCPSNSIPLNFFNTTPDWTAVGPAPILNGGTPGNLSTTGRVSGIAVDPTNPDRIFVTGASGGVWRTLNGGFSWTPLTLHIPGIPDAFRTLNMGAIAIAPSNPNIIYASEGEGDTGTIGFGVLKSVDGGDTWQLMGSSTLAGISSHSIVVDNLDPNIVYVNSSGFGLNGVFRTLNGGTTWSNISVTSGVFGGNQYFVDVELQPRTTLAEPNILYATLGSPGGSLFNGVYRTINANAVPANTVAWNLLIGGSTLVPGTGPGNVQISLSRQFPSTIFASIGDTNGGFLGVYKTLDSGVNWQRMLAPPPNIFNTQGDYDNVIAVSPINPNEAIVAGATTGPFITRDGGLTWQNIGTVNGTGPHVDHHAGVFDSNNNFLNGNDGGLFRFNDNATPKNWQSLNGFNSSNPNITALNIVQFTSVALHPRDANLALGGTQDNGTVRFNDNVGWDTTNGGDGGKVVYDYDNPLHAVQVHPIPSFGVANFMQISNDGGLTWTSATTPPPNANQNNTLFYPPLIIDPSRSSRYYFGSDRLEISENGGVTWGTTYTFPQGGQQIPTDPLTGLNPPVPITAIGVGRAAGGNAIFYVAHFGTLLRLGVAPPPAPAPATADWTDISPGSVGSIVEIVVDPQNPNNVYVVGAGGVARTQNALALMPTWTLINGSGATGLPGFFSAATIQLDPQDFTNTTDDVLYVGGTNGVFELHNPGGATFNWQRTGGNYDPATRRGLPDVQVSQLVLNTTTGIMAAGTYGAGMWEIQVRGLIRGQKYEDTNGNGVKDPGENGVPNVFIRLLNNDNPNAPFEIANTITDGNGFYEFRSLTNSQLTATNYLLTEVAPNGSVQTTANLTFTNLNEDSTFDISDPTLNPARVLIGNFRTVSISGVKFEDRNANGVQDPGEPGLPGFRIFIDSNNDGIFNGTEPSVLTGADGSYSLTNLGPSILNGVPNPVTFNGTYLIREVQQVGFTQTSSNPPAITLTSGQNVTGVNFGNIRIARITGSKFEDVNGNGLRDPGDGPLAGFTFDLFDANTGALLRTVTSDISGNFQFLSLSAGTYRVRERAQAGYTQTTANPPDFVVTATSQLDNAASFGNFKNLNFVGVKFNDLNGNGVQEPGEPGLPGFSFRLVNSLTGALIATAVSDGSGNFGFGDRGPLAGGAQYRIREVVPSGWIQTTIDPPDLPIISGRDASVSFGNFRADTISGTVYNDLNNNGVRNPGEPGLPGFTVQLIRGTTVAATVTTAADGTYAIPSVGPGSYQLVVKPKRGFVLTAPIGGYPIMPISGTNITGRDFGENRRQITVTSDDSGGPPLVVIRDAQTNAVKGMFNAYAPAFQGGVRVAVGYFNNDTIPDIVTAAGPSGGPHVRIFDGATLQEIGGFMAYELTFTGGVYVAAGDIDGDGIDEIITGTGAGGGPLVKIFSPNGALKGALFAFDSSTRGGVTVAAGDVDGDGRADIAAGSGPGIASRASVFRGSNLSLIRSVSPYDAAFTGGVFVALGDVNGDTRADLITGPGLGGGPHIKVYDGATGGQIYSFLAYNSVAPGFPWTSGAHVAAYDVNYDGLADIITAPGRGQGPRVRVLNGGSLAPIYDFNATDPTFLGGIYVGGA